MNPQQLLEKLNNAEATGRSDETKKKGISQVLKDIGFKTSGSNLVDLSTINEISTAISDLESKIENNKALKNPTQKQKKICEKAVENAYKRLENYGFKSFDETTIEQFLYYVGFKNKDEDFIENARALVNIMKDALEKEEKEKKALVEDSKKEKDEDEEPSRRDTAVVTSEDSHTSQNKKVYVIGSDGIEKDSISYEELIKKIEAKTVETVYFVPMDKLDQFKNVLKMGDQNKISDFIRCNGVQRFEGTDAIQKIKELKIKELKIEELKKKELEKREQVEKKAEDKSDQKTDYNKLLNEMVKYDNNTIGNAMDEKFSGMLDAAIALKEKLLSETDAKNINDKELKESENAYNKSTAGKKLDELDKYITNRVYKNMLEKKQKHTTPTAAQLPISNSRTSQPAVLQSMIQPATQPATQQPEPELSNPN